MPLLCLASPKGGVGKTTLAANLAHAVLAAEMWPGGRVLALDLDPQNTLRLHFGVPPGDGAGLAAVLHAWPDWRAFARATHSGVALVPHGTTDLEHALWLQGAVGREPELLAGPLRAMLADPSVLVVADLPPGPSRALAVAAPWAALVAVVLRAEPVTAALLPEIAAGRFLGLHDPGRVGVVLNGVDLADPLARAVAEAAARHLGPRLLGAVSHDPALPDALARQRLLRDVAPDAPAARDLRDLARACLAALAPTRRAVPAAPAVPASPPLPLAAGWGR